MEAEPLGTVEELEARMNRSLRYDDLERVAAESALRDASDMARAFGSPTWLTAKDAPPLARVIVFNACRRYMTLIEGVTLSRAGDETLQWTDLRERTGTVFFTAEEREQLRSIAGRAATVRSWGVFAYNSGDGPAGRGVFPAGYVATEGTREPFMVDFPSSREARPGVGL